MTKNEKTLRILKYIGLITYIAVTVFLVIMLCAFIPDYTAQVEFWKLGGAICMLVTLYASIVYIIPIILGIVCTVISNRIENKKSKRRSVIMIIAPIVTALANFLFYIIVLK